MNPSGSEPRVVPITEAEFDATYVWHRDTPLQHPAWRKLWKADEVLYLRDTQTGRVEAFTYAEAAEKWFFLGTSISTPYRFFPFDPAAMSHHGDSFRLEEMDVPVETVAAHAASCVEETGCALQPAWEYLAPVAPAEQYMRERMSRKRRDNAVRGIKNFYPHVYPVGHSDDLQWLVYRGYLQAAETLNEIWLLDRVRMQARFPTAVFGLWIADCKWRFHIIEARENASREVVGQLLLVGHEDCSQAVTLVWWNKHLLGVSSLMFMSMLDTAHELGYKTVSLMTSRSFKEKWKCEKRLLWTLWAE